MPISNIEYNTLLARVEALERTVERLSIAITRLVSIDQVTQINLLNQTEIADLKARTTAVEAEVDALNGFHTP